VDVAQHKGTHDANSCTDCADRFIAQGDHEDRGDGSGVGEGGEGDTSGEFDVFFHVGESVRILGESVNLFFQIGEKSFDGAERGGDVESFLKAFFFLRPFRLRDGSGGFKHGEQFQTVSVGK